MPDCYTPEIGQLAFGNQWQSFECPEYIVAMLSYISRELDRVVRHIFQYFFSNKEFC